MVNRRIVGFVLLFIILLIFFSSVFTVRQGQQAFILRLGEIVKDHQTNVAKVIDPGLHFKWPLINKVKRLDVRLQTLDVQSSRILTAEQKYVLVDYYVKWHIENLSLYFTRTGGSSSQAESLLQQKINDALRAEFGIHAIKDVIADDRANIMTVLRKKANESADNLGIAIIDVRLKRIDLPKEVSQSVFSRMRADREKVAAQHRADGKGRAETIRAKADAEVVVILATAKAKAAKIRAVGEKEAAEIYAKTYSKNSEFYQFYRSLLAYKNVFNDKNTVLVLKPEGQFFKYFNQLKSNHH